MCTSCVIFLTQQLVGSLWCFTVLSTFFFFYTAVYNVIAILQRLATIIITLPQWSNFVETTIRVKVLDHSGIVIRDFPAPHFRCWSTLLLAWMLLLSATLRQGWEGGILFSDKEFILFSHIFEHFETQTLPRDMCRCHFIYPIFNWTP